MHATSFQIDHTRTTPRRVLMFRSNPNSTRTRTDRPVSTECRQTFRSEPQSARDRQRLCDVWMSTSLQRLLIPSIVVVGAVRRSRASPKHHHRRPVHGSEPVSARARLYTETDTNAETSQSHSSPARTKFCVAADEFVGRSVGQLDFDALRDVRRAARRHQPRRSGDDSRSLVQSEDGKTPVV